MKQFIIIVLLVAIAIPTLASTTSGDLYAHVKYENGEWVEYGEGKSTAVITTTTTTEIEGEVEILKERIICLENRIEVLQNQLIQLQRFLIILFDYIKA